MTKQEILDKINATGGYNKHNGIRIVDFGEGKTYLMMRQSDVMAVIA